MSGIFRRTDVIKSLPDLLQQEENIPKIVMKLDSPIRSKIMNYEATVRSIQHMTDDDITMTLNSETNSLYPCLCKDSEFCDPHHGHVVTGDLRFVSNPKLRKLFPKDLIIEKTKLSITINA